MSQSPSPPRRGRFRFLYQFSLRTLLLATAAVAVFCNWYFQPKYHEEELAGKELRLRRQIKTNVVEENPPMLPDAIVNHGNWSLFDADDLTLTRGRFIENEATGNWTAWYPTGGKAAEGKMQQGVKVGRWKTWYEDGTQASDVTYNPKPLKRMNDDADLPPGGLGGGGLFPSDYSLAPHRPVASSREGPAKAWRENGKLKYEGNFAHDQQDGAWSFYDEQGRVTETGPFRAGKRHGEWTSFDASRQNRSVHYFDGRTEAELNDILARLKPILASENRRERYAALIDLADIGEGAVPLLAERLTAGDAYEQAAVLGMLPRMPTGVNLLLPRVREFLSSSDAGVAHQARLTLFQLDAGARSKLFEPLLAEAIAAPTLGQCLEELVVLYRSDEPHRGQVFAALMALSTTRDDAQPWKISAAVAELGGDVTPLLLAACENDQAAVRLQGIRTLERFEHRWVQGRSQVQLDSKAKESLLARLKNDSSAEVRKAAEEFEQPVNSTGGFF